MNDMRTPPSSIEAERAVLGSILIDTTGRSDGRVMDLCLTGQISPESFYDARNREVYSAMLAMNRASKPLDALTLMEAVSSGSFRMYWQPSRVRTPEENLSYAKAIAPYTCHLHIFNVNTAGRYPLEKAEKDWKSHFSAFSGSRSIRRNK